MWRLIDIAETDLLLTAHRFDEGFPQFYRDASLSWTANDEEALAFYRKCSHLYGVFDDGGFAALIYFQTITPTHQEVHLEAKRGIDRAFLLKAIHEIRDDRLEAETASIETWVLRQNRALQKMLLAARFVQTGLELRGSRIHGRMSRWVQMLVKRG